MCETRRPSGPRFKSCSNQLTFITAPADIALVIDVAAYPGKSFHKMQEFAKYIVSHSNYGLDRTRVGVVTFDRHPQIAASFDDASTLEEMLRIISSLSVQGSGVGNIYQGLWLTYNHLMSFYHGDRTLVQDFALVITDSAFPDGFSRNIITDYATRIRNMGLTIIVVGIGPRVDERDLLSISGTRQNLIMIPSYDHLTDLTVLLDSLAKIKLASEWNSYIYNYVCRLGNHC